MIPGRTALMASALSFARNSVSHDTETRRRSPVFPPPQSSISKAMSSIIAANQRTAASKRHAAQSIIRRILGNAAATIFGFASFFR